MRTPPKRRRKESPDRKSEKPRDSGHFKRPNRHHRRNEQTDRNDRNCSKTKATHSPNRHASVSRRREPDNEERRDRRNSKKCPQNPFLSKSKDDNHEWGKPEHNVKTEDPKATIKPNFELSGKLAEDTNTYNGVVIKYNEPSEARKPKRRWRLYPFKGDEPLPLIPMHRQSAYLIGRSRGIVDVPTDHPSCSKQHAVFQYRLVDYERDDGTSGKRVRPYIIDLDSANGTFVNNNKVDARRYVELMEKDVLKFGFSTREYVLLHEESKGDDEDDNVIE